MSIKLLCLVLCFFGCPEKKIKEKKRKEKGMSSSSFSDNAKLVFLDDEERALVKKRREVSNTVFHLTPELQKIGKRPQNTQLYFANLECQINDDSYMASFRNAFEGDGVQGSRTKLDGREWYLDPKNRKKVIKCPRRTLMNVGYVVDLILRYLVDERLEHGPFEKSLSHFKGLMGIDLAFLTIRHFSVRDKHSSGEMDFDFSHINLVTVDDEVVERVFFTRTPGKKSDEKTIVRVHHVYHSSLWAKSKSTDPLYLFPRTLSEETFSDIRDVALGFLRKTRGNISICRALTWLSYMIEWNDRFDKRFEDTFYNLGVVNLFSVCMAVERNGLEVFSVPIMAACKRFLSEDHSKNVKLVVPILVLISKRRDLIKMVDEIFISICPFTRYTHMIPVILNRFCKHEEICVRNDDLMMMNKVINPSGVDYSEYTNEISSRRSSVILMETKETSDVILMGRLYKAACFFVIHRHLLTNPTLTFSLLVNRNKKANTFVSERTRDFDTLLKIHDIVRLTKSRKWTLKILSSIFSVKFEYLSLVLEKNEGLIHSMLF